MRNPNVSFQTGSRLRFTILLFALLLPSAKITYGSDEPAEVNSKKRTSKSQKRKLARLNLIRTWPEVSLLEIPCLDEFDDDNISVLEGVRYASLTFGSYRCHSVLCIVLNIVPERRYTQTALRHIVQQW